MPPRRSATVASTGATPSQNSPSPANSGRAVARVKQEAHDDAGGPAAQPSPAPVEVPAADASQHQPVLAFPAPVNQHCLAEYYQNGEYSDLDIVSAGVVRSVHRIIVCSESPVLKAMCSNLGRDQRLQLNQYDPETLGRVLDFCYRRTYSDGEYPETVAPFLTSMTAEDVRDALDAPPVVARDVEDPKWIGYCHECDNAEDGDDDDDDDEYLYDPCDVHCPLDLDIEPVDDEGPLVDVPSESEAQDEWSLPPYEIGLFANLDLYVAAKELQIPALQLLARDRFTHSVRTHWARFDDFPALIEQVYWRTDESDPLRALISQIVAADYGNEYNMSFKAKIRELMARNGELATDVLDTALWLRREWADTWAQSDTCKP